jgi:hypothetical protein
MFQRLIGATDTCIGDRRRQVHSRCAALERPPMAVTMNVSARTQCIESCRVRYPVSPPIITDDVTETLATFGVALHAEGFDLAGRRRLTPGSGTRAFRGG